jgi:hypothetical protein
VRKPGRRRQPRPGSAGWPARGIVIAALITAGVAIAGGLLLRSASPSGFGVLSGRWLRLDGGYVLEIHRVDPGGRVEAAYLNPRPITVARAEATREGGGIKIFVELQAPGYPGSTYTLAYEPTSDQLVGEYYQAAIRQRFDVRFVRLK